MLSTASITSSGLPRGAQAACGCWNCLDSATSGVILAVSDEALASVIRAQFRPKQVHKVDPALVLTESLQKQTDVAQEWSAVDRRGGRKSGPQPEQSRPKAG